MTVLDDLKDIERRVTERMRELRPALDEYRELEAAARRLGIDVDAGAASPRATRSARARTRRSGATRRRRASGPRVQRRDQVLEAVRARPGITVPDIGKQLGVDPTGLYRVVRQLEAEGAIKKEGMALQPSDA